MVTGQESDSLPSICQNDVSVFDLGTCSLLDDLTCYDNPFTDIVIYLLTKSIFGL
jgi:hypothetical protein